MAALHSRCGHYIFVLWFLLSSFFFFIFSSPNLSRRITDVLACYLRFMPLGSRYVLLGANYSVAIWWVDAWAVVNRIGGPRDTQ